MLTRTFLALWVGTFAAFSTFGIVLVALPLYAKDELAAGELGVGIAIGAASVTAVFAGAPAGRLADRRGRRIVAVAGAAVMVAAYLSLALEPPLATVTAIRLAAGVGEAAFVVAVFTVVTDIAPAARRGEAMSVATLASYSGVGLGPVAGDLVLGDGRYPLVWLVAASAAAVAGLIALALGETRPFAADEAARGWLPPRGALVPGLVLLLALVGFGGFNAFVALYARELEFDRPGVVFAVFAAVVVLVRSVGRRIPDRLGPRPTLVLASLLLAAGLATIGGWRSVSGLLVGTAIFASGQALAYPAVMLLAIARTAEAERSAVVGSVTAFVDVALGAGASTLGAVAEVAGYRGAFLVASAVAASALVPLLALGAPRARALATAASPGAPSRD